MVPITGQASTFLKFFENSNLNPNPNQIHIQSIPFFSSSASRANLSCVVATIFTSLAFLYSSVSCIILQSCFSFIFCLHGQPELFASDNLLQS